MFDSSFYRQGQGYVEEEHYVQSPGSAVAAAEQFMTPLSANGFDPGCPSQYLPRSGLSKWRILMQLELGVKENC